MWLSRNMTRNTLGDNAETGEVTLSSPENWEADASRTVRNAKSYAPYGYSARPPAGEAVLLLPLADKTAALGAEMKQTGAAGEVTITSLGGAVIELKNDGSIVLNGKITIDREGRVSGWQASS